MSLEGQREKSIPLIFFYLKPLIYSFEIRVDNCSTIWSATWYSHARKFPRMDWIQPWISNSTISWIQIGMSLRSSLWCLLYGFTLMLGMRAGRYPGKSRELDKFTHIVECHSYTPAYYWIWTVTFPPSSDLAHCQEAGINWLLLDVENMIVKIAISV